MTIDLWFTVGCHIAALGPLWIAYFLLALMYEGSCNFVNEDNEKVVNVLTHEGFARASVDDEDVSAAIMLPLLAGATWPVAMPLLLSWAAVYSILVGLRSVARINKKVNKLEEDK